MKKVFLLSVLIVIPFILSGCIQVGENKDFGGVFKSVDKGNTFQQKILISSPNPTVVTMGNVDILSMEKDPEDNNAIYIGTLASGMYYSYDGAQSWMKAGALGQMQINSIAISPDNKCAIYATSLNKIFFSKDCNRTYKEIYHDPRVSVVITKIKINPSNTSIIFAGTSAGDLLKSEDGGGSWTYLYNFNAMIREIIFTKQDILAATTNAIYRKNGEKWDDLTSDTENKQSFRNIKKVIYVDGTAGNSIMALSEKDIIVSNNNGKTWEALKLITPPGKVILYSMDVNKNNPNEIIYGTSAALVSSIDGGKTWSSAKLPSIRVPAHLSIDQKNPNIIYMGMYKIN